MPYTFARPVSVFNWNKIKSNQSEVPRMLTEQ